MTKKWYKDPFFHILSIVGSLASIAGFFAFADPPSNQQNVNIGTAKNPVITQESGPIINSDKMENVYQGNTIIQNNYTTPTEKKQEPPQSVKKFYLTSNELSRFISPYIEEEMIEAGIQKSPIVETQSDTIQVNLVSKIQEKVHIYDEYITRLTTELEIRDKNGTLFKRNFTKPGQSHKNFEYALRNASSMVVQEIESEAILYNAVDKIRSQYSSSH